MRSAYPTKEANGTTHKTSLRLTILRINIEDSMREVRINGDFEAEVGDIVQSREPCEGVKQDGCCAFEGKALVDGNIYFGLVHF